MTIDAEIVQRIAKATRQETQKQSLLPLHAPEFGGKEWLYVKECLDTGWVSSVGSYVDLFEKKLAEYCEVPGCVVTMNGTAALHVACLMSGVTAGDEVLMPSFTFVATANAVAYCGATPHFVDIAQENLGVDPVKLADYLAKNTRQSGKVCTNLSTGRPIRALIVMHAFGHPVDMEACQELCKAHNIALIEDAAEALGSFYKGRHVGGLSDVGTLSFNGNKIITTGGGGALLFKSKATAERAKHLTTTAKLKHRWEFFHDETGFNYRLPNINAALGCAQLEQLPTFLEQKRALASRYISAFSDFQGGHILQDAAETKSNYWLNTLILDEKHLDSRDVILESTNGAGFMTRPSWILMSDLPMYKDSPRMDLSQSISLSKRVINLPSSACLGGANT